MTPKQILDSFSETLMQDERILSAQERALLATLLQHARTAAGESPQTQAAVSRVIASAVGETVAQRAFAVLGGSIVERILAGSALGSGSAQDGNAMGRLPLGMTVPSPTTPSSPGQPQPPRSMPIAPAVQPQPPKTDPLVPPTPGQPQPPRGTSTREIKAETSVTVMERPSRLQARCLVLEEFLAPQELAELTAFTLEHENLFTISEVISPSAEDVVDYDHRRSRVLMDLAKHQSLILERIKPVLPEVLKKLGMKEFDIAGMEAQITASNDGDFFSFHNDNGSETVSSRYLTFVYFFHREPRQFSGGELRIHDARMGGNGYVSEGSYQTIIPQQNQIVFFPCELMHEITPVKCPSGFFADSRFTLNGWLAR